MRPNASVEQVRTHDDFWAVVERIGAYEEHRDDRTEAELGRLSDDDLRRFERFYEEFKLNAYRSVVWDAVWFVNDGCSDDCFMDCRGGLVMSGREAYEAVLANPDSVLDFYDPAVGGVSFCGLDWDAPIDDALDARFGSDRSHGPAAPRPLPAEPAERTRADVARDLPRIWARFGDRYDGHYGE